MPDFTRLPVDVEKLREIISFQTSKIQSHESQTLNHQNQVLFFQTQIQNKDALIQSKEDLLRQKEDQLKQRDLEIDILQEALRLERMARFASHSEKLPSGQAELFVFNEVEALDLKEELASGIEAENIEVPTQRRGKPKRKPLPAHLPHEEIIIDLPEAEKICEHDHTPLKEIGAEISEQLEYIPAQMKVIRTIRKKYACPSCEATIKTAPLPEKILPKSNAAPGLLAYIATSKYVDALPLYRQEQMFKRIDIELPRNTMASWMIALAEKLQPIYNLMEEDLLDSDYVCCDETRVQVLHEKGKTPQSLSYMWVRSRQGPEINPIVLFDYDPTRSKEVPNKLLQDFKGYLQVDGYAGYDETCKREDVVRVGCMAHVRRKFFEVHSVSSPSLWGKVSKKLGGAANQVLQLIKKLYKIEEEIKEKSIGERKAIRQEQSHPILEEIKAFLDANQNKYPPQGLMGKAIAYAQHQWPYVINYLKDGRLSLDNNFTENRIRPFAVGRKNWLFSDSVAGANASAMIYSILQSARANGLEPYAYMKHLLTELPKSQTADQIEKLLPHKIDFKILN